LEVAINSKSEGEWFGPLLNFLLPLLIIVLIWVMLMRKMGGQAVAAGRRYFQYRQIKSDSI